MIDHSNSALTFDRHVWWCLMVVLAESLTRELHAGLVDDYSGRQVLSLQWMLGWSTDSVVQGLARLACLLTYSSVDLGITPLFVKMMQLISLRQMLGVFSFLTRPLR